MSDKYKEIPGWFSFKQIYDDAIAEAKPGMVYVEIGAFLGKSTHYILSRLRKDVRFHVVDLWDAHTDNQKAIVGSEDPFDLFIDNMNDIDFPFDVHRMDSANASGKFGMQSVDFLLIDGDHSYEGVRRDIVAWLPKMKKGGVIAGDDYHSPTWPGVRKAVDVYLPDAEQIGRNWRYRVV